ncbi:MAG: DUF1294 domain-containing protein [Paludibacter sp.]|nr:DUF1294 domain-containing protein [Paludibacter sp.]
MSLLTKIFLVYLTVISLLSAIFFAYDKFAAIKNKRRIPEQTLHLWEVLGGVFANLLLMYVLRHKNRKFSYWIWTWLVMIVWVTLFFYFKMN